MEISITKTQTRQMDSNIVLTGSVSKNRLVNFIFRLKQEWWHHDVCFKKPLIALFKLILARFKSFLNKISIHMSCVLGFSWVKSGTFWKWIRLTMELKMSLTEACLLPATNKCLNLNFLLPKMDFLIHLLSKTPFLYCFIKITSYCILCTFVFIIFIFMTDQPTQNGICSQVCCCGSGETSSLRTSALLPSPAPFMTTRRWSHCSGLGNCHHRPVDLPDTS